MDKPQSPIENTYFKTIIKQISNNIFVNKQLEEFLQKNNEEQKNFTKYMIEKNANYLKVN